MKMAGADDTGDVSPRLNSDGGDKRPRPDPEDDARRETAMTNLVNMLNDAQQKLNDALTDKKTVEEKLNDALNDKKTLEERYALLEETLRKVIADKERANKQLDGKDKQLDDKDKQLDDKDMQIKAWTARLDDIIGFAKTLAGGFIEMNNVICTVNDRVANPQLLPPVTSQCMAVCEYDAGAAEDQEQEEKTETVAGDDDAMRFQYVDAETNSAVLEKIQAGRLKKVEGTEVIKVALPEQDRIVKTVVNRAKVVTARKRSAEEQSVSDRCAGFDRRHLWLDLFRRKQGG
jgi:small-conductance mechanosensitive channel